MHGKLGGVSHVPLHVWPEAEVAEAHEDEHRHDHSSEHQEGTPQWLPVIDVGVATSKFGCKVCWETPLHLLKKLQKMKMVVREQPNE